MTYVAFFNTSNSDSVYVSAETHADTRSSDERRSSGGSRYKVPDPDGPERGRVQTTLHMFLSV